MRNKVILAVGAHPDDSDFGASGTIAKWIKNGATAYYLICTDGSRGSSDPTMTHTRLSKIRQQEQKEACRVLGVSDMFFLDHQDTQLIANLELKEEIVRVIRKVRPHVVITMDPTFYFTTNLLGWDSGFVNHTDHRAAGIATIDACFPLARDRLTFPEHEKERLKPHRVDELWLARFDKFDLLVDITDTIEVKIAALAKHASQFDDFEDVVKKVKKRAKLLGKRKGFQYAEAFIRIKLP